MINTPLFISIHFFLCCNIFFFFFYLSLFFSRSITIGIDQVRSPARKAWFGKDRIGNGEMDSVCIYILLDRYYVWNQIQNGTIKQNV
jgi:hypothetical protein